MTHPASRRPDPDNLGRNDCLGIAGCRQPASVHERLSWTCLGWIWGAGYTQWEDGLRAMARALRGLEQAGLITRHTTRAADEPPLHRLMLTKDGHAVLEALRDRSAGGER